MHRVVACLLWLLGIALPAAAQTPRAVSYRRDVLPILRTACLECHNARLPAGGLSVASYAELLKGGRSGPAVTPGKSPESRLVRMLSGLAKPQMPPGAPLKPAEIEAIRRWVDAGARSDAPAEAAPAGAASATRGIGAFLRVPAPVNALAFRPDGKVLAIGTYQRVLLCDTASWQVTTTWTGHADAVRALAYSADGKWLAAGGGNSGGLGEVRLWNVAEGRESAAFGDHADALHALAFSPDGTRLATGSADKSIKIWEVPTGKLLQTLRDHADAVLGLSFHPGGKYLASCSADRNVKIWDTASWRRLYSLGAHDESILDIQFSPSGAQFLTASADRLARVWNFGPESSQEVRNLGGQNGHRHTVWAATFSPDGRWAATASADKSVKLWNAANGDNAATLTEARDWVYTVRFSPDSQRVAAGTWDGQVLIWKVESRQLERQISTLPPAPAATARTTTP